MMTMMKLLLHHVILMDWTYVDKLDPENIFQVESKWKDRSLLYTTVQAYAAATGI